MLTPDLLAILCCPETHQPVTLASDDLVQKLNAQIASGAARNRAGQIIREPIDGGLIRKDGKFLYLVRKEIPVMLIDEAIPLP